MKKKTTFIDADYKTWKEITHTTLYNCHYILESVKILLDTNIEENQTILYDHPFVAAGLYTFALEEYGKFLLLYSISQENGKYRIMYRDEFRNHTKKFEKALENIPEECKLVHKGSFGKSFGRGFDTDEIADFETRLGTFYSDFDEEQQVQKLPQVDAKSLQNALTKFTEIVEDRLEKFTKQHFSKNIYDLS